MIVFSGLVHRWEATICLVTPKIDRTSRSRTNFQESGQPNTHNDFSKNFERLRDRNFELDSWTLPKSYHYKIKRLHRKLFKSNGLCDVKREFPPRWDTLIQALRTSSTPCSIANSSQPLRRVDVSHVSAIQGSELESEFLGDWLSFTGFLSWVPSPPNK